MQLGIATTSEDVSRLSNQIENSRKQLDAIVSEIGRLDASRSPHVDVSVFRTMHDTVQKAVEGRLKNISLFRKDAAHVDEALSQVEKALDVVRREMANLNASGASRVTGAVSSSSLLFASSGNVKDIMLNLREVQVALSNLELAKSKVDTLAIKQKIKIINNSIQSANIEDAAVREVKKEIAVIYDDFVRADDGLIALRVEIQSGKNSDARFQSLKKRHLNVLNELNIKLTSVLDSMENKIVRNRSEVDAALGGRQRITVVSETVNSLIGDMKTLEAKIRLLMLSDNEKGYETAVSDIRQLQGRLRTSLAGARRELSQLKQINLIRSMDGASNAVSRADVSIERIISTQKNIMVSSTIVAKAVAAVKESSLKELKAGETLVKETSSNQERMVASVNRMVNRQMTLILSISVLVSVVALAGSLFTNRRVGSSLKKMTFMLQDVAQGEGDLTKRLDVSTNDEFAEASLWFNTFIDKLNATMTKVAENTRKVAEAASGLRDISAKIATGADQVAFEARSVSTSSEELAATSMEIALNCSMAVHMSRQASEAAETGATIVGEAVDGMTRLADRVKSSSVTMEHLGARSRDIGNIIETIEHIADQTNLLALNAAIEAARAGEQGRGFAVVADEVRALAVRTTEATAEISMVIKGIVSEIGIAVQSMGQGGREAEVGMEASSRSKQALEEIVSQIDGANQQLGQVAQAAELQTATTGEISANILRISEIVGMTAEDADVTLSSARQLACLADDLGAVVGQFKLSV
jgi:methyl-accepting chemotaxis protein